MRQKDKHYTTHTPTVPTVVALCLCVPAQIKSLIFFKTKYNDLTIIRLHECKIDVLVKLQNQLQLQDIKIMLVCENHCNVLHDASVFGTRANTAGQSERTCVGQAVGCINNYHHDVLPN